MWLFSAFTSRQERTLVLQKIITKLNISQEEKDIYILSLDILDDKDFTIFFENIKNQISESEEPYTIAPMGNTLF